MLLAKKLKPLKGREANKHSVVVANGPSVNDIDYDSFPEGSIFIGMNASILLCDSFPLSFQYYVFSDMRFFDVPKKREMADRVYREVPNIIAREEVRSCLDKDQTQKTAFVRAIGRDGFSHDLSLGYYFGCTSTMLALQLANHLGCSSATLLGVDLNYDKLEPTRFYNEQNPQVADDLRSVQVWNLANAYRELAHTGMKLEAASYHSVMRPYIPFADHRRSEPE